MNLSKEEFLRTDKVFRHPDRLKAYLNEELVRPITVEIHLTNKCNLKCYYCTYKDKRDTQTLTYDEAKLVIKRLCFMGVRGLTFSGGGEPTLHPCLVELAEYAKLLRLDVGLITNGVVLPNPEALLRVLTWIRFSVDTNDPATYSSMKGADKLGDVINNIKTCVLAKKSSKLPVTIGLQMVSTDRNYQELLPMLELAEHLKVDYFQFRPVEKGTYNINVLSHIQVDRDIIKNRGSTISVVDSWYKWKELEEIKQYTSCPGADFIGAVDAYGDFYMCCHHVQDKTACYGSLLTQTGDEVLLSRKKVQASFDYSKCPIACRGAVVNRRLGTFRKIQHVNFL